MTSSPITAAVAQPDRASQLLDLLATVPESWTHATRAACSYRLAVAVTAVLAGSRSFAAIEEWAADLSEDHLAPDRAGKRPAGIDPAQAIRAS